MKDKIRRLQKDGEYRFIGLSRSERKKAATELSKAAMEDDRRNGTESRFGIARDAFGYYYSKALI